MRPPKRPPSRSASAQPFRLAQLAEIFLEQDAVTDALAAVDEALGLSSELLDCMYVPELQRLKGECKLRSQQGARCFALRSAVSLATLLATYGRGPARAVLEPIYASFTDGVDTADLRAARALLTSLD